MYVCRYVCMYVCMCACPQVCMYVMSRCLTMPARSASNDERQGQRLHPRGGQGSQSCEVRNRILGMRWARQCYCCYYTATATTTTTTTPTTATTTTLLLLAQMGQVCQAFLTLKPKPARGCYNSGAIRQCPNLCRWGFTRPSSHSLVRVVLRRVEGQE